MKGMFGFLVGALVLAGLGLVLVAIGRFERDMADAQQYAATEQYAAANDRLADAQQYASYGRWVPRVGSTATNDVRARQAALAYWQRNYEAVLPRDSDPVGGVEGGNLALQTIVANAAYRAGQASAHDRATTLQAYDEAIGGFQTVLKNEEWNEDAAFNYEFLIRERDLFAKGRAKQSQQKPPDGKGQFGNSGAPQQAGSTKKFEIYVPLNGNERTKAGEAGKGTTTTRKG
jgi:hypothetical protein